MTQSEVKIFSVNKFMTALKELTQAPLVNDLTAKSEHVEFVHLYFIPSHAFRNQFNQISIRPVAMFLKNKGEIKYKSMNCDEMIKFLNCIPIITFEPSNDRRIYKNQKIQKLAIFNEVNISCNADGSFSCYYTNEPIAYYESRILPVNDEELFDV